MLLINLSDPHSGNARLRQSRRGRRAASPSAGASLQPDLGDPRKESNGNLILNKTHAHYQWLLISDPHTGNSGPKQSRRGWRAVSPSAGTSLQPDLGEPGKERNGKF